MDKWQADFVNDPNNDFNLVLEITFDGDDFGVIKRNAQGLEIIFYPSNCMKSVPFSWFQRLLKEAEKSLLP